MFGGADSMPAVKKRLGASILLTVLSLVSIILLLPTSRVSTQLQKIALGTTIDGSLWNWGSEEGEEDLGGDGIRLVIFGDSWVDDTVENGQEGKGKSWGEVLCEEINCTSRLNFAASQPFDAWPAFPPTGVMTSNEIHESVLSKSKYITLEAAESSILPDLATQIQSYIALGPPKQRPTETIFVVSFGFWDIYDFSRMDYPLGQNGTDTSIKELFSQLDGLYNHFVTSLYPPEEPGVLDSTESTTNNTNTPSFRVIIPKLFDPTLLPGWLTLRPAPPAPSSIAEQQKNAVYLTERWNNLVENQVAAWVLTTPKSSTFEQGSSHDDVRKSASPPASTADEASTDDQEPQSSAVEKDVFYFDLPKHLLDIIVEHQLEDESLSDASGLGTGESPFESVYQPCVREAEEDDTDGLVDLSGMLVCKEPEEYLFWDSFNLGSVVKGMIGKGVGEMVKENKSLRQQWKGTKNGIGGGH